MKRVMAAVLAAAVMGAPSMAQDGGGWAAKKSGWLLINEQQRGEVFAFGEQYKAYLSAARTALTSTRETIRMARAAGFAEFTSPSQVKPGARLFFNLRDRAIILAVIGSDPVINGVRLVATHHDSPHLDLKARPIVNGQGGFALLKTIFYGGLKRYQWASEPLALIGRIDTTDGRTIEVAVGTKPGDPVLVIPDVAPHADADLRNRTYTGVLTGEEMNPVVGSIPGNQSSVATEVMKLLAATYKITEEDLASAELQLVPAQQPADVGLDRGLLGGYGHDDRLSSYCAVRAVLDLRGTPRVTAMAYLSNFEEVGSGNNTGAASELFNTTLAQLIAAQQESRYTDLDLRLALRSSQVISADTNDGVNPIFPQTVEQSNAARLGYGPTLKFYGRSVNANSEFTARMRGVLDRAGIPWQTHTPKVGVGTGGTIGGFFSAQEMEVIDMGVPLLSMHATFEVASKVDIWNFYRFMLAFYQAP